MQHQKRKKLFIHIGVGKTGTTALQMFFMENAKLLKTMGISYPMSKSLNAQHHLPEDLRARVVMPAGSHTKDLWDDILGELNTEYNMISTEFFWGLQSNKYIKKIEELTGDFDVKIVVYLRRQDKLLQSKYNQSIKGQNAKTHTFREFYELMNKQRRFVYSKRINPWAKIFGNENLIIRLYDKSRFHNGSIFDDFLHHVLGIELTDQFVLPKQDPNIKLHRIALEYKRMVNYLPLTDAQKNAMIKPLQQVSERLHNDKFEDYPVISPDDQLDIIREYESSNEIVARKFLNQSDGQLFTEPIPDTNQPWQPYNELTADDAKYINEHFENNCPTIRNAVICGIIETKNTTDKQVRHAARLLMPGLVKNGKDNMTIENLCHANKFNLRIILNRSYKKLPAGLQRMIAALAK